MVGGKCGKKLQKQAAFDKTVCFYWIVLTKKMHRFSCSFYDIFTLDLLYCYSYNLSNINFAFLMAVIQSHLSISGGLNFDASYLLRCGSLKSTVVLRLSKHKTTPLDRQVPSLVQIEWGHSKRIQRSSICVISAARRVFAMMESNWISEDIPSVKRSNSALAAGWK